MGLGRMEAVGDPDAGPHAVSLTVAGIDGCTSVPVIDPGQGRVVCGVAGMPRIPIERIGGGGCRSISYEGSERLMSL